jgi:hypothetical protein
MKNEKPIREKRHHEVLLGTLPVRVSVTASIAIAIRLELPQNGEWKQNNDDLRRFEHA